MRHGPSARVRRNEPQRKCHIDTVGLVGLITTTPSTGTVMMAREVQDMWCVLRLSPTHRALLVK